MILRADRLGDLILTTPLVRALADAHWQVSVVCRRDFLPVLENNPHVAAAHGLEDLCPRWPRGWWQLSRHLRRARYDAILIPQAAPPALAWASACSGIPLRIVLYGGKWASLTLHQRVPANDAHSSEHYARQVLSLAGMLGISAENARPEIFLRESELAAMRQNLRDRFGEPGRPLVVLHAGGGHLRPGQRSSACNLPVDEYARLTGLLLEATDCRVVITGNQSEAAQLEPAWAAWRNHPRCWYAVGAFALREFAALLQQADLTIVGSTGPLHLASAVGATTLSPFCSALGDNAATWGNQGGIGHVVERSPATCPRRLGQSWACGDFQGEITASHLFERANGILKNVTPRADHLPL
ncbi:MAG: glycosyltransferase family 9 protein [Opitutales bacterium]